MSTVERYDEYIGGGGGGGGRSVHQYIITVGEGHWKNN